MEQWTKQDLAEAIKGLEPHVMHLVDEMEGLGYTPFVGHYEKVDRFACIFLDEAKNGEGAVGPDLGHVIHRAAMKTLNAAEGAHVAYA